MLKMLSGLLIPGKYLVLGAKPILLLTASAAVALLKEFIGAATNFVLKIDGKNVLLYFHSHGGCGCSEIARTTVLF
jgi:hypothetical protein